MPPPYRNLNLMTLGSHWLPFFVLYKIFYTNFNTTTRSIKNTTNLSPLINLPYDSLTFIYCFKDESGAFGISSIAANEYNYSKREREIVELLLKGSDRQQIAEHLCISVNTVNSHLQKIYKKTKTNNMHQLITKLTKNQ